MHITWAKSFLFAVSSALGKKANLISCYDLPLALTCCLTPHNHSSRFVAHLRRCSMRCLMKVTLPVLEGNAAIADGSLSSTIGSILADLKPEAVYFSEENGARTGFLFVNMESSSQ